MDEDEDEDVGTEMSDKEFLLDLCQRLMFIPVMYGMDQGDIDRLREIASELNDPLCSDFP